MTTRFKQHEIRYWKLSSEINHQCASAALLAREEREGILTDIRSKLERAESAIDSMNNEAMQCSVADVDLLRHDIKRLETSPVAIQQVLESGFAEMILGAVARGADVELGRLSPQEFTSPNPRLSEACLL